MCLFVFFVRFVFFFRGGHKDMSRPMTVTAINQTLRASTTLFSDGETAHIPIQIFHENIHPCTRKRDKNRQLFKQHPPPPPPLKQYQTPRAQHTSFNVASPEPSSNSWRLPVSVGPRLALFDAPRQPPPSGPPDFQDAGGLTPSVVYSMS